jgi:hypothetical protein
MMGTNERKIEELQKTGILFGVHLNEESPLTKRERIIHMFVKMHVLNHGLCPGSSARC